MNLSTFVISIVSRAQCASAPLALAVDCKNPSGPLIVSAFDPTQPAQLWLPMCIEQVIPIPQPFPIPCICAMSTAFVNVLTGLALYSQGQNGSPALQVPVAQIGLQTMWFIAGGGYMAIRLLNDENQNLRIDASAPFQSGTAVTTNGWGGGLPNEVWTCIQTSAPYPDAFDHVPYGLLPSIIEAGAGLCLSSNGTLGDTGQLTVQTPTPTSPSQQFYVPIVFDSGTGTPEGMALINVASGNAAHSNGDGDGATVIQAPYSQSDGNSIWTAPIGPYGLLPLRPLVDVNENMNIPGDGPYTPGQGVVTWNWAGGQPNEVWTIKLATAKTAELKHSHHHAHTYKEK